MSPRRNKETQDDSLNKDSSLVMNHQNTDSFLEGTVTYDVTKTTRKNNRKALQMNTRALTKSVARQKVQTLQNSIEGWLSKKIQQVNPSFGEAFKYYDINYLRLDLG